MSRWVITSIATTIALSTAHSLWGWGRPRTEQPSSEKAPQVVASFPLNDQQQWYMRESYLLWHPQEDDVDWADRTEVGVIGSDQNLSVRLKKPDFGWHSGARLAIGRYLPNHDNWDVAVTATYFYANTENHASPNINKQQSLQSSWTPVLFSSGLTNGEGTWRLNFFTFDLGIGRNIGLSKKITAHPFVDLRGALIYENDAAKYFFQGAVSSTATQRNRVRFKGFNDFWGIGPRIGSDFTFYLGKCWTFLGSLSGSLLLGEAKVHQYVKIFQEGTVSNVTTATTNKFHTSHHEYAIRGNLEGSLGIGWEKWVSQNRVRIAPSIVFEAAEWYDMNQWVVLKNPAALSFTGPAYFETDRRHGDLTFWGFNFNLQVDF